MEQLRMSTGKDSERVVQILTDLMKTNKEFQIMITVPAAGTAAAELTASEEKPLETAGQAAVQAPGQTPRSLEKDVTDMIHEIGVPAHIKGYQYLRTGVKMAVENPAVVNRITKELYPGIAARFDTTASKVERAIRHAIEVAWNRGRVDTLNRVLGCRVCTPEDKPTNGEFIAMLADKLRLDLTA